MCKHIYNQERTYPKGTPFTYLISWTDLDIHYYGVRYNKTSHPDDLWTTYFTSSKIVKKFRESNSEPNIIKIDYIFDTREEALEYENTFLKDNNCIRNLNWLNKSNGGKDYCCLGHTDETKNKMAESQSGFIVIHLDQIQKRVKKEKLQYYLDIGWQLGISDKNRQKLANSLKGIKLSEEHKQKLSFISKGKPKSEETRKKMSDSMKGKPKSEEQKRKQSLAMKGKSRPKRGTPSNETREKISKTLSGRVFINNGIEQKSVNKEEFIIYQSLGYTKGKLSNLFK